MMRQWLMLIRAFAVASLAGCGSSSSSGSRSVTTQNQQEQDQRDNAAIAHQVNQQVEDRAKAAATEEAVRKGEGAGGVLGITPETICTKQSSTAYKCLSRFPDRPGMPSVVTNVTCGRNGENCIIETQ